MLLPGSYLSSRGAAAATYASAIAPAGMLASSGSSRYVLSSVQGAGRQALKGSTTIRPARRPCPCLPCSAYSPSNDAVLSFVSSYLGTRQHTSAHSNPAPPAPGQSGGSGAIELHTDARLWEVQWPELVIHRLVGHGSFGSVYLAEWHQIRVAVKLLVGKGEGEALEAGVRR